MARVLGLGEIVKVDEDDSGSGYTTITLLTTLTRAPRRRVRVPDQALEDVLATESAGIEEASDAVFTIYSDPGSTQDTIINTLFGSKNQVLWQFLHSDAGTETAEYVVMGYEPAPIVPDQHQLATVTIHRRTAITYA